MLKALQDYVYMNGLLRHPQVKLTLLGATGAWVGDVGVVVEILVTLVILLSQIVVSLPKIDVGREASLVVGFALILGSLFYLPLLLLVVPLSLLFSDHVHMAAPDRFAKQVIAVHPRLKHSDRAGSTSGQASH